MDEKHKKKISNFLSLKSLLFPVILILLMVGIIKAQKNNLEYFNKIADTKSDELVFAIYHFNPPFGGVYHETKLDKSGVVYSVRVNPRARQDSHTAELTETQIQEIRDKLSNFTSKNCPKNLNPQEDKLYSVLVFRSDQKLLRCNFIGQIPIELQVIYDFLKIEYNKTTEKFLKELKSKETVARGKYGDWENNPSLIRYVTSGFRSLKNENTALLFLTGKQQPVIENSKEIPLYYALVLYPNGHTVGGAGSGTWSFEPISRNGITWAMADESLKELVIEYNVIDYNISIKDKVYQLNKGNLFIIKIDKGWKPNISQLNAFIKDLGDEQTILSIFEKELGEKLFFRTQ